MADDKFSDVIVALERRGWARSKNASSPNFQLKWRNLSNINFRLVKADQVTNVDGCRFPFSKYQNLKIARAKARPRSCHHATPTKKWLEMAGSVPQHSTFKYSHSTAARGCKLRTYQYLVADSSELCATIDAEATKGCMLTFSCSGNDNKNLAAISPQHDKNCMAFFCSDFTVYLSPHTPLTSPRPLCCHIVC